MSTVSDLVKCPQCGYEEADYEFNCRTRGEETLCNRCGYRESWEAKRDEDGQLLGWKHDISQGAGALWYRPTEGIAYACHSLHSANELAEAERWLKERLAAGTVEEDTARLTRWNKETRSVELVLGTLDYASKMEQLIADLGLNPIRCSDGKIARFAVLPGRIALMGTRFIVPAVHYLNAEPSTGKYVKRTDGSMPAIECEIGYLALSHSELGEIKNLKEPELSLYGIDIVMSASGPEFGREFRRVCNRARWTLDPATEKQVRAQITESPHELDTQCAERSDIELFADLESALESSSQQDNAPNNSVRAQDASSPASDADLDRRPL